MPGCTDKYPLCITGTQILIEAKKGAQVLGKLGMPITDPADSDHFASIHCNPPGPSTDNPAIVRNAFGKGKALYVAADLENHEYHRNNFVKLIKSLVTEKFSFESDAPEPVEIVAFHQGKEKRYIVNVLNFQKYVPSLPIENITIRLNTGNKKVKSVATLPDEKELAFKVVEGGVEFTVARLEVFQMLSVNY